MSFPQIRTYPQEFTSTLLSLLNVESPGFLPSPNNEMMERFNPNSIFLIMIDNFGLFEAVVYKPEALIKKLEAIAVLETEEPYAIPLIDIILNGPEEQEFNLLQHVSGSGKVVQAICREDDQKQFGLDQSFTITIRNDMSAYVESTKHIFRSQLLYVHFLDFESLYAQHGHRTPPKKLLEKIVRRTDNWIKVFWRQARKDTLFVVVGNHGRTKIPLDYDGKLAEWRNANAPIAVMFQKRTK
ncbi:MAG: hypothetical protein ACOC38_08405 [Promethearchaeia archaeon]